MEMGGDHGAPPFRQDEKEISQEIRVVDNRVKNRLGIQEMVKEETKRKAKKETKRKPKGKRKRKAEKESENDDGPKSEGGANKAPRA